MSTYKYMRDGRMTTGSTFYKNLHIQKYKIGYFSKKWYNAHIRCKAEDNPERLHI